MSDTKSDSPPATESGVAHDPLALLDLGIGVSIASRDANGLPDLVRALGATRNASGTITVYVSGRDARDVLDNLRRNGAIAVVFSQPTTHRTVQVKADAVSIEAATDADVVLAQQRIRAMAAELERHGYERGFTERMLSFDPADLTLVRLRPEEIFDQTPGPQAGRAIGMSPQRPA
ncbi:MAG: pyridoxamine 5'-phosphate oxidase family protein [Burkholderiaceae bacterium]|nr:pyridoxamine 5'-phosphate oxidase family protein [Burkholderiaceae bacterium]